MHGKRRKKNTFRWFPPQSKRIKISISLPFKIICRDAPFDKNVGVRLRYFELLVRFWSFSIILKNIKDKYTFTIVSCYVSLTESNWFGALSFRLHVYLFSFDSNQIGMSYVAPSQSIASHIIIIIITKCVCTYGLSKDARKKYWINIKTIWQGKARDKRLNW